MNTATKFLNVVLSVLVMAMLTGEAWAFDAGSDATTASACQRYDPKHGALAPVGGQLAALYCEALGVPLTYASPGLRAVSGIGAMLQSELLISPVVADASGQPFVVIDATAARGVSASTLLADLQALGLQDGAAFGPMVSGKLPVTAIGQAAGLDSLNFVRPALAATNVGSTTSQGDEAMGSDDLRTNLGVDGTGVTVGVIANSYNCLSGAAADETSGDLPSAGVNVLLEEAGCMSGTDEGRAMAQVIHDVAPGADLAFHTGFGGQAVLASGISSLSEVADVVVDDINHYTEPFFQDGIIAQAVDTAVASGDAYFSAAGNFGDQSYESAFVDSGETDPAGSGKPLHDFDPSGGIDAYQQITIPVGGQIIILLQWNEPYASASGGSGATNDLDIFITDMAGNVQNSSLDSNVGGDPIEFVGLINDGSVDVDGDSVSDTQFQVAISHYEGAAPSLMKYIFWGTVDGVDVGEYLTHSSTVVGHSNAAGAAAVGAAYYGHTPAFGQDPPLRESRSSIGGTPILFDLSDNPINDVRDKPGIVAPDGTNTTFFGNYDPESDGFPNFFGTSAAAAHAAGLAALLLVEYDGTLSPAEQYALMEATAIDMDAPGFDHNTGWGLVQADFIGADFSDLPSSYGYTWHPAGSTLRFGTQWTGDTSFAAGQDDDNDDGITPTVGVNWTPGTSNGSVDVTVGGCGSDTCYVNAWMDFDNSGAFGDSAGEQILTDVVVVDGPQTLTGLAIPASPACFSGGCNVRFRLSTASGIGVTCRVPDGEVSDYTWSFGPNAVGVSGVTARMGAGRGLAVGSVLLAMVVVAWVVWRRAS